MSAATSTLFLTSGEKSPHSQLGNLGIYTFCSSDFSHLATVQHLPRLPTVLSPIALSLFLPQAPTAMSAEAPSSGENLLQVAGCIAALFLQDLRAPPEMTESNVEAWLRWSKRIQAHAVRTPLLDVTPI